MRNFEFDENKAKNFLESLKNKEGEEQIALIRNYVSSEREDLEKEINDLKADLYTEIHDLSKLLNKYSLHETRGLALNLVHRYKDLLLNKDFSNSNISKNHILNMLDVLIDKVPVWTIDKIYRWIGFIQGVLIVEGITSVHEEREYTRPLFHQVYVALGHIIPETISIKA